MDSQWPSVPISRFATQVWRAESVDASRTYRLLGAHWYAKGLYVKEEKPGSAIRAGQLFLVTPGDFVYNRLFAWKGSFALAEPEHTGCHVSNEFPCFELDNGQVDPKYLHFFFSRESAWIAALGLSSGSTPTSRNRLKERQFLQMTIALPPLDEQRRIVARIEELAGMIEEARGLRVKAREEVEALCRAVLFDANVGTVPTPMNDLVTLKKPDIAVQPDAIYHFAGVYSFGRGIFQSVTKSGAGTSYERLTTLLAGDFVYPKLMAWEGAFGIVPQELAGCVVSPEFPVFRVNEDKLLPETLDIYFRTPASWQLVAGSSIGTNVRRRRLHPDSFLKFRFPLPPMRVQMKLREVNKELDVVRSLQHDTQGELEGLLPAVLERGFRGEL